MDPAVAGDEEESFPLSSNFDFNSSLGLYSSDHGCYRHFKDDDDDDIADAYIELELRPPPTAVPTQVEDEELNRISFSTLVPFPGFRPASHVNSSPSANHEHFPPARNVNNYGDDCTINNISSLELVHSRRKILSSKMNGCVLPMNEGIMKLLVKLKCRIISLGSIKSSHQQMRCLNNGMITNLMKPLEKWFSSNWRKKQQLRTTNNNMITMTCTADRVDSVPRSTYILKHKSCPTSINSSPIHQGDASLIHAAIAHCKKSFGQTEDFSF